MTIPYNGLMARATSASRSRTGRGRPREFDMDTALDSAAQVFRERGYHATSISHLTQQMSLASGSVYKAFKDKEELFLAAFDHLAKQRSAKLRQLLSAAKSGRDRVRATLLFCAEASSGTEGQRGCLVVGSLAELATFDAVVARRVTKSLAEAEELLSKLLHIGQADGSIAASIDAAVVARSMLCVLQGMRVVGKTGRRRAEMAAVADAAMKLLD
jgi:AcrR family transcriptional regulator